ncbi:SIR2 family protein [Paenibacillus enshidis]|uniref:SIR2 family protein n=1 Tax=Paenibacillus enshidis TaxID=1458439 RepID=A0ABV5B003_9BACL
MKKNLDIEAILDAINKDHLVVFVGAGVSANSNLPSWSGLVKELASGLGIDREIGSDDYLKIPQYYYNQRGENEYFRKIMDIFDAPLIPNIIHNYILKLKSRHIITTNYDNLIEQAIEKHFMFYDVVKEDLDLPYSTNFKLIESYVRSIFINNTVLFVGYSLQDYDLKLIMKNLEGILGEHFQKAYLIDSSDSPKLSVEKEYFKNLGVNLIDKFDIPIDFCYEKFQSFNSLNKIRVKDLVTKLDIGNKYFLEEGGVPKILPNEENNIFIDLLDCLNTIKKSYSQQEWEIKRKYDYINFTLSKLNLSKISVEEQTFIFEPSYKKEPRIIGDVLSCNYFSIDLLAKQDYKTINEYEDIIINELGQSICFFI